MDQDTKDFVKIRSRHLMSSFGLTQAFAEREALRELITLQERTLRKMNGEHFSIAKGGRLEA